MNMVTMTCPNCGACLNYNEDDKNIKCEYCGSMVVIEDHVAHIEYEDPEEAGYQFEKGRQRALEESGYDRPYEAPSKPRKTWLWVLGWIFIFPVPLTIIISRNKRIPLALRIIIIAAAWIFYLILVGLNGGDDRTTTAKAEALSLFQV